MPSPVDTATPLEIAALWSLGWVDGPDIAAVCMRWLEEDLDQGDADVAAFAGEPDLLVADAGPAFERSLKRLAGRIPDHDEALLIALRLHLAFILEGGDLLERTGSLIAHFRGQSERRLVRNPRRLADRPDGVYAEQELGLEYVYGGFFAFDDVQAWPAAERLPAEAQMHVDLRQAVHELHDHLGVVLARPVVA